MTITAKYAATCPCCKSAIRPGDKIEWSKGSPAKHVSCASKTGSAPTTTVATRIRCTTCAYCQSPLDRYQVSHGFRFCSQDCKIDARTGGQSGYVGGVWHQGDND